MTEFDPKLLTNTFKALIPTAPAAPQAFEEPQQAAPKTVEPNYHGFSAVEMAEFLLQNVEQLPWEDYETLLAVVHGQPYFPEDLERIAEAFFKPREPQPEVENVEEEEEDEDVPHYLAPMPATPVIRREPQVAALPPTSRIGVGAWWRKRR